MATSVLPVDRANAPQPIQEPKGKFQRLSDWAKDHKTEIAVAILIIGIAIFTFGVGSILAIIPLSHFTIFHVGGFVAGLFTFNGVGVTGLSTNGILFFTGAGALIVGGALTGFGSGMLAGIPKSKV